MTTQNSNRIQIGNIKVHFREQGKGEPVLLLHGWPTSSFLWRNIMPIIATNHRVIAPDLPGFGESDKPTDIRYSFEFFSTVLDGLVAQLGLNRFTLVLHDLGGPIGLYWALKNVTRIKKLVLLNTIVYPSFSEAAIDFVRQCSTPGLREKLTSAEGLRDAVLLGVSQPAAATEEVISGVQAPFATLDDRLALAFAGSQLNPRGFVTIARGLGSFTMPVRIIYGEDDRVLPEVADTMRRVQRDLPHAIVTSLPGVGHFLQEEDPVLLGNLIREFVGE
ncbi:MAG: alpha/beta fold hydrolase [Leptospirales bacterium]|nr:alpha/beta fold hydrolase [Leptospirales bacterium]